MAKENVREETDKKMMDKVPKKVKEGWLKVSMMIECLGSTEDAARSALDNHIKNMGKEDGVMLYKKSWHNIQKIDKPWKGLEVAYSYMVEVEVLAETFDRLFYIVANYGPSNIEIFEPKEIRLSVGEAQGILISVADIIHQFARQGIGGMVIKA